MPRRQVLAWALWDGGTSPFSVLITTFVFARDLTSSDFVDPAVAGACEAGGGAAGASGALKAAFGSRIAGLASQVGWALAIGGFIVALLAPIVGRWPKKVETPLLSRPHRGWDGFPWDDRRHSKSDS